MGHLAEVVEGLDTKPIIMGHSFGGAFTQLLLDAGYDSAGVSIDGAAVKGIRALPASEIKATFPVLHNPASKDKAVPITEKDFHYAFTNNLTEEESHEVFDRYAIPLSGRIRSQRPTATYGYGSWHRRPADARTSGSARSRARTDVAAVLWHRARARSTRARPAARARNPAC
jgi:hypothetical protein